MSEGMRKVRSASEDQVKQQQICLLIIYDPQILEETMATELSPK